MRIKYCAKQRVFSSLECVCVFSFPNDNTFHIHGLQCMNCMNVCSIFSPYRSPVIHSPVDYKHPYIVHNDQSISRYESIQSNATVCETRALQITTQQALNITNYATFQLRSHIFACLQCGLGSLAIEVAAVRCRIFARISTFLPFPCMFGMFCTNTLPFPSFVVVICVMGNC